MVYTCSRISYWAIKLLYYYGINYVNSNELTALLAYMATICVSSGSVYCSTDCQSSSVPATFPSIYTVYSLSTVIDSVIVPGKWNKDSEYTTISWKIRQMDWITDVYIFMSNYQPAFTGIDRERERGGGEGKHSWSMTLLWKSNKLQLELKFESTDCSLNSSWDQQTATPTQVLTNRMHFEPTECRLDSILR